ncbi:hypothetical protein ACFL54_02920 [Planctomycetota bacterium]
MQRLTEIAVMCIFVCLFSIAMVSAQKAETTQSDEFYLDQARKSLAENNGEAARTILLDYIKEFQKDYRGYALLGQAYCQLDDKENEEVSLNRAYELALKVEEVDTNLMGGVITRLKDLNPGWKDIFELNERYIDDLISLAQKAVKKKEFSTAVNIVSEARTISPFDGRLDELEKEIAEKEFQASINGKPIFNGKSLGGSWVVRGGKWSVKDACIVGLQTDLQQKAELFQKGGFQPQAFYVSMTREATEDGKGIPAFRLYNSEKATDGLELVLKGKVVELWLFHQPVKAQNKNGSSDDRSEKSFGRRGRGRGRGARRTTIDKPVKRKVAAGTLAEKPESGEFSSLKMAFLNTGGFQVESGDKQILKYTPAEKFSKIYISILSYGNGECKFKYLYYGKN